MPPDVQNEKALEEAIKRGHEAKDIRVRWVLFTAGVLAISVPVAMFFLWLMFKSLAGDRYTGLTRPVINPLKNEPRRLPPKPRLQVIPGLELKELRAKEDLQLNTYGWINRTQGIVRIPIERAMELTAQRGLPVRKPNVTNAGQSEYELILQRRLERGKAENQK
jgi:hypothetical protein